MAMRKASISRRLVGERVAHLTFLLDNTFKSVEWIDFCFTQ
jgi:hypothetical protein